MSDLSPGYTHAQTQPLSGLTMGHISHKDVANAVRMLGRNDIDHEAICVAARDRIAWLANRVDELERKGD